MTMPLAPRLTTVAMLLLVGAGPTVGRGAEKLTVTLQSGRTFTAWVDAKTNSDQLWLRFEEPLATVWRPVDWNRVVGGAFEAQTLTADEVRQVAERIKSKPTSAEVVPALPDAEIPVPVAPHRGETPPTDAGAFAPPLVLFGQPKGVQIEARVANWDADAVADGLIVTVSALDAWGNPTPVEGYVTVELLGGRPAAYRGQYVYAHGAPFPSLGQWTSQINTFEAPAACAQVRLPFQAWHPEFDADLSSFGLVTARLVVPGEGVFETSTDFVRIRPFSPLRDQLQQLQGRRYFAGDWLGP